MGNVNPDTVSFSLGFPHVGRNFCLSGDGLKPKLYINN